MRVLAIRPREQGDRSTIADFDIEISSDCRLYHLRLIRGPGGRLLSYAPSARGGRVATFSKPLAQAITEAATDALAEQMAVQR